MSNDCRLFTVKDLKELLADIDESCVVVCLDQLGNAIMLDHTNFRKDFPSDRSRMLVEYASQRTTTTTPTAHCFLIEPPTLSMS